MKIFQISTDVEHDIDAARRLRDELKQLTGRMFYIVHLGDGIGNPSKKVK